MRLQRHWKFLSFPYLPIQIEMCNGIDRTIQESFNKIGLCDCTDVKPYLLYRVLLYLSWISYSTNVNLRSSHFITGCGSTSTVCYSLSRYSYFHSTFEYCNIRFIYLPKILYYCKNHSLLKVEITIE